MADIKFDDPDAAAKLRKATEKGDRFYVRIDDGPANGPMKASTVDVAAGEFLRTGAEGSALHVSAEPGGSAVASLVRSTAKSKKIEAPGKVATTARTEAASKKKATRKPTARSKKS